MTTTADRDLKTLNLAEVDGRPVITATDLFREATVDAETGVISNVTLLSSHSTNDRIYTATAMEDAVRLYDGARYFLDHPTERELRERNGNRDVKDLVGRIRNPRRAGAMVRGDIEVLEGAPHRDLLFSIARQMPEIAGNSHRATGKAYVDESGTQVVERLESVEAVELVTNPATTHGLFESENHREGDEDMKLSDLTIDELRESRSDLVSAIEKAAKAETDTEKLEADVQRLKEENDALKVKLAARERDDLIAEKLEAADLPEFVLTDLFSEQLEAADDEDAIDALIAERKELAETAGKRRSRPKSKARDLDEELKSDGEHEPVTEEAVAGAYDALWS